jgi:cell division protein FtsB
MSPTFNEKLIAYLTLISGLAISGVAEYYSIMGLIAIYPSVFWPIVIMGVVLGLGKISGTVWLKQNWEYSPWFLKAYILPAIIALMLITSLGVFGFLSKAHSDQSLVSGDVQSKIAVYDEKIKTAKDNIDANRKALKQMDEAVDQVMGRSNDEKGADKAVQIRRGQLKERNRLQAEIQAEQKTISNLTEERAPIAAEVRKVEAEVGPIKYIAHLLYGENPDANILEKAVIWVTVLIVIVLDPLAVILLLASQYSFQRFRKLEEDPPLLHNTVPLYVADVGENPIEEELKDDLFPTYEEITPTEEKTEEAEKEKSILDQHPYLTKPFDHFTNTTPLVYKPEENVEINPEPLDAWNKMIEEAEKEIAKEKGDLKEYIVDAELIDALEGTVNRLQDENTQLQKEIDTLKSQKLSQDVKQHGYSSDGGVIKVAGNEYSKIEFDRLMSNEYVQNEEQQQSGLWKSLTGKTITEEEYIEQAKKQKDDNTNNPA